MNTSGRRIARKYNDKIIEKVWEPASSVKTAFVQEYIKQLARGVNNSNTYNKYGHREEKYYIPFLSDLQRNFAERTYYEEQRCGGIQVCADYISI